MTYAAPVEEILFALRHLGGLRASQVADMPGVPDDDTLEALLTEAGRFAAARMAPLYRTADQQGARFANGVVSTTPGFPELYRDWIAGGWNTVTAPEDQGGMGMPLAVGTALLEIFTSANMAFMLGPVLTQAAVEVLAEHAEPALRDAWIGPLVSGEWSATMALTEPQAGSDLGALRSRAEPAGDGSYRLRGQKIFISWGEHDLTPNIVHLVLARLPDAPVGTRGISLFLVPKILPGGTRNDLRCAGIEHKLGLHGSPTCTMVFGDEGGATGWIIGAPHRGLAAMFTMMNRARLATGLQGVALAERAAQTAIAFAAERRQGVSLAGVSTSIDGHPDVRRMLLKLRSATLVGRAICYETAAAIDTAERTHAPEDAARAALLTPLAKAWPSDAGVEAASLAMQVHGGMGYVEETGVAQLLRDARIVPIYEGTNGIQAIDLVLRKVLRDEGIAAHGEIARLREAGAATLHHAPLAGVGAALAEALDALEQATLWLLDPAQNDAARLANASAYLTLFATTAGTAWLAGAAAAALTAGEALPGDLARIIRFTAAQSLPLCTGLARIVTQGADSVLQD